MIVIRMQRTGRKGHAMFRVVVQDSRQAPTSGKVVARLGSFDPHTKATILDKEKAAFYLEHGAQPSPRVVRLLTAEGVKLPSWVKQPADKERVTRNADKRRSTRPEEPVEEVAEATAEEAVAEVAAETPEEAPAAEAVEEAPVEVEEDVETPAEEPVVESEEAAEPAAETPEAPAEEAPAEDEETKTA
ncbi:MAG: 30S ribosomal protein S16 [Patescibacteria group bacterium]